MPFVERRVEIYATKIPTWVDTVNGKTPSIIWKKMPLMDSWDQKFWSLFTRWVQFKYLFTKLDRNCSSYCTKLGYNVHHIFILFGKENPASNYNEI